MSEHDVWESRYGVPDFIFGKEPNHFLMSCRNLLPGSGKALAIADGEGRNGVWLAEQGLDVVALDFSEAAQIKAALLAKERGVEITLVRAEVLTWDYPANAFDVVIDIFTQFSSPEERAIKWQRLHRTLKPGGLVILQGYSPRQLQYGTGGPKKIEKSLHARHTGKRLPLLSGCDDYRGRTRHARRHCSQRYVCRHRPDRAQIVMRYCKAVEMFGLGPVALEAMNYLL